MAEGFELPETGEEHGNNPLVLPSFIDHFDSGGVCRGDHPAGTSSAH